MDYRELQQALKPLKLSGLTAIKLNLRQADLQAEYDRLKAAGFTVSEDDFEALQASNSAEASSTPYFPSVESQNCSSGIDEDSEFDPEIAAAVAESWTDDPSLAIATAAAYTVAGFAMLILWIALITTTCVLSGLKCWHWCRQQFANLSLQLKHLELPIENLRLPQPLITR